jgi:hypothetical protein
VAYRAAPGSGAGRLAVSLIRPAALAGLTAGGRGLTAGGRGLTAGGRGPAAWPSAARMVNVETPVAAAICRSVCPAASSPAIRAASAGVSFDAPFGPRRTGTSPATPPQASAWSHRQMVAGSTPNASATWPCDAPLAAFSG